MAWPSTGLLLDEVGGSGLAALAGHVSAELKRARSGPPRSIPTPGRHRTTAACSVAGPDYRFTSWELATGLRQTRFSSRPACQVHDGRRCVIRQRIV